MSSSFSKYISTISFLQNDLIKSILKNGLWSFFGTVISKGALFFCWLVVARILGAYDYGQFGIVRSTITLFVAFAGFGLGLTASKHIAQYSDSNKQKTSDIISMSLAVGIITGILISVLYYFSCNLIAIHLLDEPDMTGFLRITTIILLLSSLNGAQSGVLQGLEVYKSLAVINIFQSLLSVPIIIICSLIYGVEGTIWSLVLSYVILVILTQLELKKRLRKRGFVLSLKRWRKEIKLLFSFSIPALFSSLMIVPFRWFTESLVVRYNGFEEMGVFTAAFLVNGLIVLVATTIGIPLITTMSKSLSVGDSSKLQLLNFLAPLLLAGFLIIPLLLFPDLILSFFGADFSTTTFKLTYQIGIVVSVLILLSQSFERLAVANSIIWPLVWFNSIWGITLLTSAFLWQFTSYGTALSLMTATAVQICCVSFFLRARCVFSFNLFSDLRLLSFILIIALSALYGYFSKDFIFKIILLLISYYIIYINLSYMLYRIKKN